MEYSETLFPLAFGLLILIGQYYFQWRDCEQNKHDPHLEQALPELLESTKRFEGFIRFGAVVALAKIGADLLLRLNWRRDVAILGMIVAYCLVLYRKRRYFTAWVKYYQQRAENRRQYIVRDTSVE